MPVRKALALAGFVLALTGASALRAGAQDFGQNKVQYDKFDFKVLQTTHFDIYYYSSETDAAQQVARMAERWNERLSGLFGRQLTGRQTVVLYGSHPEFEQTNVVEGLIDEGTGGVTESAERRVVLPLAASLGETDHVLGHELVHAFQYTILGRAAETMPLWFMEGMAEYLSLGPRHVQTAIWLRDAALQGRLPKIQDLEDPRNFPYRFGQAFWAYIGGRWGDDAIGTIIRSVATRSGGSAANAANPVDVIESVTGMKRDELSVAWQDSIGAAYGIEKRAPVKGHGTVVEGERVIGERAGGGYMNIGPSLSPDGKLLAYLSEQNRLAVDLYVVDVDSGRVLKKLTKTEADPHFQSLQFIASAGAWDPQSRQLAVAAVRTGRPILAIFDVKSGDIVREIPFGERGEIFQPSWSPDGKTIAFSAQVGGLTDLYTCDLATGAIQRLTQDQFADLQPTWSSDGKQLTFVTDQFSSDLKELRFGNYQLARIDVASHQITALDTGVVSNQTNPQWSTDGRTLFFLADATGRPEIYRMAADSAQATRLSNDVTGVSGITDLSPAFSVASVSNVMALTVFYDRGYEIQVKTPDELAAQSPEQPQGTATDLAALPPIDRKTSLVAQNLQHPAAGLPDAQAVAAKPYAPKFRLISVGQQIGASSTTGFGTYVSGGISMLFSDVLGNNLLSTAVDINGGVKDVAAQASYINRSRRWSWGVFGDRVPLLSAGVSAANAQTTAGQSVYIEQTELDRQTYSEAGVFTAYPLSRASRIEFNGSAQHIGFSSEVETDVFDPFSGALLQSDTTDLGSQPGLRLGQLGAAFVRDTSSPGATGPIVGQRLRFEADPTFGDLRMTNVSLDARQYVMPLRPITFAGRVLHVGRYGAGGEDERLQPLYLGYPTLIRGYDANSLDPSECGLSATGACPAFDRLFGSRLLVVNAEARIPAGGLFTHNLDYGPVPTELFAFFDAGLAWSRELTPTFVGGTRDWVRSAGFGARVNLFGFAIGEFNLVRPLDRPGRGWMFVFNLRPGF